MVCIHEGIGFFNNSSLGTSIAHNQNVNVSMWKDAKTSKYTSRIKFEAVELYMCSSMLKINWSDCENCRGDHFGPARWPGPARFWAGLWAEFFGPRAGPGPVIFFVFGRALGKLKTTF